MKNARGAGLLLIGLIGGCPADLRTDAPLYTIADELESLSWLTGSWIDQRGDRSSEEHWTAPAGGSMLGMNRLAKGQQTAFFEYLRIENTPEGVFYVAHPKARSPGTRFKLVERGPQRAVFENLEHDNPKRIIYWREGDVLHARTEGDEGGRPVSDEYTWRRTVLAR